MDDNNEDVKRKLICVDDINYSLMAMRERLKEKYDVYPAQSAERMFEILDKVKPDLIILDVNMPDVDGFEALRMLKSDKKYEKIPVIFLTGQKTRNTVIKCMQLGAADVLTKPYTPEQLTEFIEYQFDTRLQDEDKPVVLAVDDNPGILQTINSLLGEKYIVYTLPSPQLLNEILKKVTPDLFLIDYNMPMMNGFDLVPVIHKYPQHAETPIILVTGEGTVDFVTVAKSLGVKDYIVKPIDETVLHKKIALHTKDYILRRRIRSLVEEKK
jgi:PleD family two-component response regulator